MKILRKIYRLILEDPRQVAGVAAGLAAAAIAARIPALHGASGVLLIAGVVAGMFWSLARSLGGSAG